MKTAYTLLGALFLASASWNGMLQAAPNALVQATPTAPSSLAPTAPGQAPTTARPAPSTPGNPNQNGATTGTPPYYYNNTVPVYTNQAPRSPDIPRQSAPMQ